MKETFNKTFVKRSNTTLQFLTNKDGSPVLGEVKNDVRIPQEIADELNAMWKQSGIYYSKVEKKKTKVVPDEKDELWEVVDKLVDEGKIEKPHHATGVDKLKELIKNAE